MPICTSIYNIYIKCIHIHAQCACKYPEGTVLTNFDKIQHCSTEIHMHLYVYMYVYLCLDIKVLRLDHTVYLDLYICRWVYLLIFSFHPSFKK